MGSDDDEVRREDTMLYTRHGAANEEELYVELVKRARRRAAAGIEASRVCPACEQEEFPGDTCRMCGGSKMLEAGTKIDWPVVAKEWARLRGVK